jgi:hypothetical protein
MSVTSIVAILAGLTFVITGLVVASVDLTRRRGLWIVPAAGSALFLLFSVVAVVSEGPTGFWPEHTRNLWGNQIWLDLLLCATVGFTGLAPRARALGMRLVPWFILVASTGAIGLLAMSARFLFLRDHAARAGASTPAMAISSV